MENNGWTTQARFVGVVLLFSATACASVGPAPAMLSADLGNRISEMRGLHQLALERVFDAERRRIEDFVDNEWTPLFLKNYMAESNLMSMLERFGTIGEEERELLRMALEEYLADPDEAETAANEVADAVTAAQSAEGDVIREVLDRFVEDEQLEEATLHVTGLLGSADPGLLILEWAGDAQAEINAQRREMLEPLAEAERQATAELTEAYADMLKANGVITARLEAAADVKAQQDALLRTLGVGDAAQRLQERITNINGRVTTALGIADRAVAEGNAAAVVTMLREALGRGN